RGPVDEDPGRLLETEETRRDSGSEKSQGAEHADTARFPAGERISTMGPCHALFLGPAGRTSTATPGSSGTRERNAFDRLRVTAVPPRPALDPRAETKVRGL